MFWHFISPLFFILIALELHNSLSSDLHLPDNNECKIEASSDQPLKFQLSKCSFKELDVIVRPMSATRDSAHLKYEVRYVLLKNVDAENISFASITASPTSFKMESGRNMKIFQLSPGEGYVICAKAMRLPDLRGCFIIEIPMIDLEGDKLVPGLGLSDMDEYHVTVIWDPVNMFHGKEKYMVSAEDLQNIEKGTYFLIETSNTSAEIPLSPDSIISVCVSLHIEVNEYPANCIEITSAQTAPQVSANLKFEEGIFLDLESTNDNLDRLQVSFSCLSTAPCNGLSQWNSKDLGCPGSKELVLNGTEQISVELPTYAMWLAASIFYFEGERRFSVGRSNLLPPRNQVSEKNFEINEKTDSFEINWKRNELEWLPTSLIIDCNTGSGQQIKNDLYGCDAKFDLIGLKAYTNYTCTAIISAPSARGVDELYQMINLPSIRTRPGDCDGLGLWSVNGAEDMVAKKLDFLWALPQNRTGIISDLVLIIVENLDSQRIIFEHGYKCDFEDCIQYCETENRCKFTQVVPGLKPERHYKAKLSCKYRDGLKRGSIQELNFTTDAGVPVIKEDVLYLKEAYKGEDTYNQVVVYINNNNIDQQAGKIIMKRVYYAVKGKLSSPKTSLTKGNLTSSSPLNDASVTEGYTFSVDADQTNFTIINLIPETYYSVKLRYFTEAGYAESRILHFRTSETPLNVGAVAAAMVTLLAILLAISFVSNPNPKYDKRVIKMDKTSSIHQQYPIKVKDCVQIIERLISGKELENQFYELSKTAPDRESNVAKNVENEFKNRYLNILPFDFSRVILDQIAGDPYSDYINASYLHGYKTLYKFIASQGPLDSTRKDFWRMVWEKDIKTIVMLTNCVESRKDKCSQYWPDPPSGKDEKEKEHEWMDKHFVELTQEETLRKEGFILRKFRLRKTLSYMKIKHSIYKNVTQYHFYTWPDHGVPTRPSQLVNFILKIRENTLNEEDSHILIHCSAGVGRTGTYILLDTLIDEMQDKGTNEVDIFSHVQEMRCFRPAMIQTQAQYVFAHKCAALIQLALTTTQLPCKIEALEEFESKYSFLESRKKILSFQQSLTPVDNYKEDEGLIVIDEEEETPSGGQNEPKLQRSSSSTDLNKGVPKCDSQDEGRQNIEIEPLEKQRHETDL